MAWTTLASAIVGAVIATGCSALLDRSRWRREQDDRLISARRALYGEYLACLSRARNDFRSLVRNESANPAERERSARESFAPCFGMRYQMSITAASKVFDASERAFRRLRDVRDLAAAGILAGDEAYSDGRAEYEVALFRLREAMRLDLGADREPAITQLRRSRATRARGPHDA
ncbi:hypothetical protein VSR01_27875 [Actinacidiphila sp. DG2A-62]|uniref:hypothetical protein n=1 Tax=Actinacidiphila sp. DG2A-62 TaxID=3108821 RepID=UPI002DB8483A|nr:hypothetical protein [Actinacidiphila sp. DG2A-62]MEC3997112.1 hypothetical protein [Actinacidiphila sp. DG2A-62]